MSRDEKPLAPPVRPRQMEPMTPSLPRIGTRASESAAPSTDSFKPLNRPWAWVTFLRITVSPCWTRSSGLALSWLGTGEPPAIT